MRLKELRQKRKISQVKLAMDLSMNQNSISRYENGTREADYKTLIRFADYFDVSIDYLLERTDNPKVNIALLQTTPNASILSQSYDDKLTGGRGRLST